MRVALTITELHPGGAERCFVNLARFLKERGHEVSVWQLWPDVPANKRFLTDQLDHAGICWRSGNAAHWWDFPAAAHWLRRQLLDYEPDIVQSFLFHANIATAYALRNTATPLFGGVRVRQPQAFRQWLQRQASQRMTNIICVSQSVADHCVAVERIEAGKVVVIPNGIDLKRQVTPRGDWRQLGILPGSKVLLYVGRLDDQKGIVPLVMHCQTILEHLPNHHLVIMGDGPQRAEVERAARRSHESERIHLVGWQAEAQKWMNAAEMLLLPARYEGMPNVVLEAMAAAMPVVCFEVEGVRELLGEEQIADCQLAPPMNFQEFSEKVLALANDEDMRTRCGTANRRRIEEHFPLEKQLMRYEQLFLQTLGGRRSPNANSSYADSSNTDPANTD